jgi:pimeloyl-ACP methyl ester carboxylesterase
MDEAALHGAHVVGNSLGGWLALELARRGRARTVVAISPSGLWTPREAAYVRRMVLGYHALAKLAAPLGPVRGGWVGALMMLSRPWRVPPEALALQTRRLAGSSAVREAMDDQVATQPPGLPEIAVPVLIAWGTRDRLLFPRQAKRFERLIPGAELQMLPGLGHMPMADDPEAVAATILRRTA